MVRILNLSPVSVTLFQRCRLGQISDVELCPRSQGNVELRPLDNETVEVGVRQTSVQDARQEHLPWPVAVSLDPLQFSSKQQEMISDLLLKHQKVFSEHDEDYGHTDRVLHVIPTGDAAPIRDRYNRIPPKLYQEVRGLLNNMLENGIIKESYSPWAAPVVLVRKKDGTLRFCVDYRRLNSVTHKDSYPLPRIEESLASLKKSRVFSTLDLAHGYWQVGVHSADKEKTAFVTPMGLYEFNRMQMGLCNAPGTFQRLVESCLGDQNFETLLLYLDDIIVFSPSFEAHITHLDLVFSRLGDFGLKVKLSKCSLFQSQVHYLGHVIAEGGVSPDPEKLRAVEAWVTPQNITQLRAFLGLAGYYRRFIKDFAQIAAPLNSMLWGTSKRRTRSATGKIDGWAWGTAQDIAFNKLKESLLQAPILAYADLNGNADALSRWPVSETSAWPTEDGAVPCGEVGYVAPEVVRAGVHAFVPVTEDLEGSHKFETVVHTDQGDRVGPSLLAEWRRAQRTDPAVSRLWIYMDRGRGPSPRERAAEDRSTQVLLRQWARLCVDQGLLCREVCDPKTFDKWKQIVVPQCLQSQVLEWVHDHAGHLGAEKTLGLTRRRFFWPGLVRGVEKWCLQCVRCNLHKTPVNKVSAPLV
uniref:Gypsy retrotransposon integrase-like protein 1 n=1 Tax=Cyprinus carpio TaxID=7962 RepID=A0A8C1X837_CYPCA